MEDIKNEAIVVKESSSTPTTTEIQPSSSSDFIRGLDGLPHHLLSEMKTNIGVSVEELSHKHVVMLVFLRYFGCVFCQKSIVEVVNSLQALIKLNCVPVFVHQESSLDADEFFSEKGMPLPMIKAEKLADKEIEAQQKKETEATPQHTNASMHARSEMMKQFLRVADPEGNYYYKQFGVKPGASTSVTIKATFESIKLSLTEGFKLTPRVGEGVSRDQLFGTFVVAHGKIVNQFVPDSASVVPDFIELLLDLEGKSSDNSFFK